MLIPARIPPHKEVEDEPGPEVRLELCRLATGHDDRLSVSDAELRRPGPSYTVDTLEELSTKAPDNELFLIVGGDIAAGLPRWREPEKVLSLATLAVAERPGTSRGTIDQALAEVGKSGRPAMFFPMPSIGISSSDLRERVAGESRSGTSCRTRWRSPLPNETSTGYDNLMNPEQIVSAITGYAADRKALDIVQLDLREILGYTDYFVICSGRTDRQTKAIHDAIHQGMKHDHDLLPRRVEGLTQARWILMDYLDVVVHVFTPETREYYRLEQLWGEAPAQFVEAVTG